jgi:hypothetical protein
MAYEKPSLLGDLLPTLMNHIMKTYSPEAVYLAPIGDEADIVVHPYVLHFGVWPFELKSEFRWITRWGIGRLTEVGEMEYQFAVYHDKVGPLTRLVDYVYEEG